MTKIDVGINAFVTSAACKRKKKRLSLKNTQVVHKIRYPILLEDSQVLFNVGLSFPFLL